MIKYVGLDTGKVYAEGSRAECCRQLQVDYPYMYGIYLGTEKRFGALSDCIYPEPLKVVRE